jgi:DNA-binding response OmpR family regulator
MNADDPRILCAHVANLRRKIESPSTERLIRTDRGVGDRFADVARAARPRLLAA